MQLVLNGRFMGRPVTGVDRAAIELTRAMLELLKEFEHLSPALEIALPPGPEGRLESLVGDWGVPPHRVLGRAGGHFWEQNALRGYRSAAWLLNFCNTAPVLRRRQLVMMYDAQFITQPQSYSLAFRAWYRVLLTAVGRTASLVFTSSEASRQALEAHHVVPRGKTRVVWLGVDHMTRVVPDPATLSRLGLTAGRYVLAIGSLAPHKNLVRLVRAFVAADLVDVRLVVAGGGNPAVFRDAGLPVADAVDYVGRVSDAELKALYEDAMVFACPSISEGFGLPPLEAMASGCPVIATTGGSVPEMCGEAAIYADPFDVLAWTAALRRVAGDSALRVAMAEQSRRRANLFTWERAARQMLHDLAEAAGDTALLAALAGSPRLDMR